MSTGRAYLVGAGPGDPRLITVRGQELLRHADVVVYDHLVSPQLLKGCHRRVRRIYVGKEASRHTMRQEAINRLLVRAARSGKTLVRLKGGDPFVFGRGGEEALALAKAGIPYEVVPGVTSAVAAPAYAGIPVTHRQVASSVAFVTGHEDPTKAGSAIRWEALGSACDTLVFLMGVSALPTIAAKLARHGRSATSPCAVIEWGTLPRQRTVTGTLRDIVRRARAARIAPPAVLVVGDVVALRRRLNWYETKPLFGKRILVTRAAGQAGSLTEQLETLGASVVELPAIELAPVKSNGALRAMLAQERKADWVFFTSPEGIGWFARGLKPYRRDVRWLSGCHIGAIGPKTAAALEAAGLHVDFLPKRYSQEGMLEDFPARVGRGKQALILSAEASRDVLETGLRRRGMRVTRVPIYRTVIPRALAPRITQAFAQPFHAVTVTSASCVEHVFQALQQAGASRMFRRLNFASIGPVTSAAVRHHGGRVVAEAAESTMEGLVDALVRTVGHT